jgi:hypothetical protein
MSANYTRQSTWVDGPGGGTPVSAARLNAIETGIEAMDAAFVATVISLTNAISGKAATGAAPTAHAASHAAGGGDVLTLTQAQVTGLGTSLAGKSNLTRTEQTKAANYTLVAADADTTIYVTAAAVITVPTGLGLGFSCTIVRTGAGAVTIAASGTTLAANVAGSPVTGTRTLNGQYAAATIEAYIADTFLVAGNVT